VARSADAVSGRVWMEYSRMPYSQMCKTATKMGLDWTSFTASLVVVGAGHSHTMVMHRRNSFSMDLSTLAFWEKVDVPRSKLESWCVEKRPVGPMNSGLFHRLLTLSFAAAELAPSPAKLVEHATLKLSKAPMAFSLMFTKPTSAASRALSYSTLGLLPTSLPLPFAPPPAPSRAWPCWEL